MGNYAMGLGVVKALSQGMEGKFRDRLARAQALNPALRGEQRRHRVGPVLRQAAVAEARPQEGGGAPAARHRDQSARAARARLPGDVIPRQRRAPEAKRLLDEVNAAVPGRYDAPEERRAKAMAAGVMPELYAKLK